MSDKCPICTWHRAECICQVVTASNISKNSTKDLSEPYIRTKNRIIKMDDLIDMIEEILDKKIPN